MFGPVANVVVDVNALSPKARLAKSRFRGVGKSPRWQSLGESNPSFQVENLTS